MPGTLLAMPMAKAALLQRSHDASGAPLLTLYHRGKEVSWDEARHFAFGEAVTSAKPFLAADAAQAGALAWEETLPMLTYLADEGLLVRAGDLADAQAPHDNLPMPSPLSPAPMVTPRSWMDGSGLMAELTGKELDLAWLESVVPVFRTGHLFMDRDGRQVGEANVFPARARIDAPTEWRGCPYAGNRYQAEKPMNMTALKAMRQHWRSMMAMVLALREAYLERCPEAREGWTVGHVERLAVSILALPSVLMLRCDRPLTNGDLHPALSNLFRVTDGLRQLMHLMLFVPAYEPMLAPDEPIDAEMILAYADRNFAFHSETGVCAGPRFMIEDFLAAVLEGKAPRSGLEGTLDPELARALDLIPQAIDYAMLGLQSHAAVFSLWPLMARTYDDLNLLLSGPLGMGSPSAKAMAKRFSDHFAALSHRSFLASEEWRSHREAVYDDMEASCQQVLTGRAPWEPLSALLEPRGNRIPASADRLLAGAVQRHFGAGQEALALEFTHFIRNYLLRAQRIVIVSSAIQLEIAALLHRPDARQRLTLQDINLHNVLMGEDVRSVPFLTDEIGQLLGVTFHVDARTIEISPRLHAAGSSYPPGRNPGGSTVQSHSLLKREYP